MTLLYSYRLLIFSKAIDHRGKYFSIDFHANVGPFLLLSIFFNRIYRALNGIKLIFYELGDMIMDSIWSFLEPFYLLFF